MAPHIYFAKTAIWVPLAISTLLAYPIYLLLIHLKSRQTVSQYAPEGHQVKQGTPTMGGLIIAVGFLAFSVLVRRFQEFPTSGIGWSIPMLFAGFTLIGFIDDYLVPRMLKGKRGLGWKQKILMQFAVATACCWIAGGGYSMKMWAAVFLVLFFSNAYNFSDGLDWLAGTLLYGFCIGLLGIAAYRHADHLELYIEALMAAALPFMFLNRPKAKVFMGDVGSLPIGAFLGFAVAILAMPRFVPSMYENIYFDGQLYEFAYVVPRVGVLTSLALLILSGMMIVELVPVPLQILSVKLRKKKLFSFTPIHHAFEKKGMPEGKVMASFAVCQLALSILAIAICAVGYTTNARELSDKNHQIVRYEAPLPQ